MTVQVLALYRYINNMTPPPPPTLPLVDRIFSDNADIASKRPETQHMHG